MAANIVRQCTLQNTDLTGAVSGCTKLGSNKFWKGWVVDHGDGTADFCCLWGSTGKAGKTTGSKHGIGLNAATSLYEKKRKQKLSPKKGYTEIQTRSDDEEVAKQKAAGVVLDTKVKKVKSPVQVKTRQFHPDVSDLLGVIYGSTARAVVQGLSSQAGATADNPIGNLSDSQLDKGGIILDEIGHLLETRFGHETQGNKGTELPLRSGVPTNEVIELTNDYYSNVPRPIPITSRGRGNLHRLVVSSFERLQRERDFMQLLRDAHLARATFAAAAVQPKTTGSKEVVWYDGLSCDIEAVTKGSAEWKRLLNIFEERQSHRNANFYQRLKLTRAWSFQRKGKSPRFDTYTKQVSAKQGAKGVIQGFHGTRTANLMGISQSGLLMPERLPPGISKAGSAFGVGIYIAPRWSSASETIEGARSDGTSGLLKACNYSSLRGAYYHQSNSGNKGYVYLQDVALGRGEVRTTTCWGQKRPSRWPQQDFIYANAGGCSSLTHDEIVVFDEDALRFSHLFEIELR